MEEKLLNKKAPPFTLPSSEKKPISLKDFKGKFVVVYFYLNDETSGCTIEALEFKKSYWNFVDLDVAVLGISPDDVKSHINFIKNHDLPFPLLSDIDHTVGESYDVWQQKVSYGKEYWGIERSLFIIDEKSIIRLILKKLKPHEYPLRALEYLVARNQKTANI